ncbi:DUF4402 domain-containing protein [Novosphingobium taihuense]|uniref:DUF4402 domain-containing protein n=1 Tax=Novosphingobium taihuense TaxID=260085 RepID=A0A7W7A8G6_9SPHN|nr:DUF4402 domain-containing protein [Novosphingobium taihuense]MBB4612142.1 hypothetical protein [Novosphingobium taihuense]TWH88504.1 uncharacterized protein DUF4402 [Novosphingobium taihuense]
MKKLLASAAVAAGLLAGGSAFAQAANTSSATASGSVTIVRPLTITKNSDLAFGRIVRPRTGGTGTVTLANTGNTVVAASGAVALASTTSRAQFTVDGEGGQSVTASIPSSVNLTSGTNTIAVTLLPDFGSTVTLSGALAAAGSSTLNVGGSFSLPDTQATGAYTGNFTVTVTYQ